MTETCKTTHFKIYGMLFDFLRSAVYSEGPGPGPGPGAKHGPIRAHMGPHCGYWGWGHVTLPIRDDSTTDTIR